MSGSHRPGSEPEERCWMCFSGRTGVFDERQECEESDADALRVFGAHSEIL